MNFHSHFHHNIVTMYVIILNLSSFQVSNKKPLALGLKIV